MRLVVVGTGFVGLVTGAGFADFGNDVLCVDVDGEKIARLGNGEIPFYEPGLQHLVARNVRPVRTAARISARSSPRPRRSPAR